MYPNEIDDSDKQTPMPQLLQPIPLVLGSGSQVRAQMLKSCGLKFTVEASNVDEEATSKHHAGKPVPQQAQALANAKALSVSIGNIDAVVLGADQMCELDGKIFGKPGNADRAAEQLRALSGKTHKQVSAVALARGGEILWEHHDTALLTMRELTEREIFTYIELDEPFSSCGSYKFESYGRHLFASVKGLEEVIKGLPLLATLNALRRLGAIKFS